MKIRKIKSFGVMLQALIDKLCGEYDVRKENVTHLKKYNAARVYVGTI